VTHDGAIGVQLGRGAMFVPAPFDALVRHLVCCRPRLNTGTNSTSLRVLVGKRTSSHFSPSSPRLQVMRMGIDPVAAGTGALRQLVMDCPPVVVADMLGYGRGTVERNAVLAALGGVPMPRAPQSESEFGSRNMGSYR
jgi:hypothetical protein